MLPGIFSEAFMSPSDKHNYKTFTQSAPASLLHWIENILNHLSGKCRNSLADSGCSEFHHVEYHLFTDVSLATA